MNKRFFYGYVIVFILFFLQMLMFGPRGSYGVFIKPLTDEFDWSRALVAGAFSLSSLTQGIFAILMGGLNDRLGPRVVLTVCGFLVGTGLMLMYLTHSPWQLYLFYSALIGVGMGGLYTPQMSTIARWFVKRRNIMSGIVTAGGGIGGLIGPPVITWIIYTYSWRQAFLLVGLVVFILVIFGAQFLKRDPSKMGLLPDGKESPAGGRILSHLQGLSLREAVRTSRFWLLNITICCFGFYIVTLLVHIVPFAIDRGISATVAAVILAALNGAMTVGSVAGGLAADKIGSRRVYVLCFCFFPLIILFLLPVTNPWLYGLFVVVLSLFGGGVAITQSTLVADIFGLKSHGIILGCTSFAYALGTALGALIAGLIFDSTGGYQGAFLLCTLISLIALVSSVLLTRKRPERRTPVAL